MWGIVGGTLEAAQIDATMKTGMPLTDVEIRGARPSYKTYQLADVAGMYLEVSRAGAKYGQLKDRFTGKEKRLALCV